MQERLRSVRTGKAAGDRGFTLIELLVVVVIIGVLVGIAVPLYLNYRKGAENKSAESDVRGAISAVEQFYTENENVYPPSQAGTEGNNLVFSVPGGTDETATVSSGNTLVYANRTSSYVVCGKSTDGGTIYVYNSANGGAVAKSSRGNLADCAANGD